MKAELDFGRTIGPMRPVHGVNNGPVTFDFMRDASDFFRRVGIPYSRLHDTEGSYGAGEFVDIPAVFKCFDADADDPANYNFEMTDHYIRAILDVGTKVIYRLGVSIENGPHKRYIYPPKDYRQWAKICAGIIRHYTEGWANGFVNGVECFEIWNEPEFYGHMWMGTHEEFYRLFKDTIIYLKEQFPNVRIGGPATGNFNAEFTNGFFEYLAKEPKAPLDFFSFHTYFRNPEQISERIRQVRETLAQYGYESAKIFCTEWNHVSGWTHMEEEYAKVSDHTGAAFVACALCELQNSGYDIATYYDAQFGACSSFNGLFKLSEFKGHDSIHPLAAKPSYYAMEMFGDLYRMGSEVYSAHEKGVSIVGATDGETDAFLIGRYDAESQDDRTVILDIKNTKGKTAEIYRYVPDRNTIVMETVDVIPNTITLAPYGFARVVLKA